MGDIINRLIVNGESGLTQNSSNWLADPLINHITVPKPNRPLGWPCEPNDPPYFTMH